MFIGIWELSNRHMLVRFGKETWVWDGIAWAEPESLSPEAGITSRLLGHATISGDHPKALMDIFREWSKAVAVIYTFDLAREREAVAEAERIVREVRTTRNRVHKNH